MTVAQGNSTGHRSNLLTSSRLIICFALSVGIGSLGCGKLSDRRAEALLERSRAKVNYATDSNHSPQGVREITFQKGQLTSNDIRTLSAFPNLRMLSIHTPVSEEIGSLPSRLTELRLRQSGVLHLEFLQDMQQLESLHVAEPNVIDHTPIGELSKLKYLFVSNLRTTYIADLQLANSLTSLSIRDSRSLADIDGLAEQPGLTSLNLISCPRLTDCTVVENFSNLERLQIVGCPVNLLKLPASDTLQSLILVNTNISRLDGISSHRNIRVLKLGNSPVTSLDFASDMSHLSQLSISGTNVADLSPISHVSEWGSLDLSSTVVSDLSPVSDAQAIDDLHIHSTGVKDLSPLDHVRIERITISEGTFDAEQLREFFLNHINVTIYEHTTTGGIKTHFARDFGVEPTNPYSYGGQPPQAVAGENPEPESTADALDGS